MVCRHRADFADCRRNRHHSVLFAAAPDPCYSWDWTGFARRNPGFAPVVRSCHPVSGSALVLPAGLFSGPVVSPLERASSSSVTAWSLSVSCFLELVFSSLLQEPSSFSRAVFAFLPAWFFSWSKLSFSGLAPSFLSMLISWARPASWGAGLSSWTWRPVSFLEPLSCGILSCPEQAGSGHCGKSRICERTAHSRSRRAWLPTNRVRWPLWPARQRQS